MSGSWAWQSPRATSIIESVLSQAQVRPDSPCLPRHFMRRRLNRAVLHLSRLCFLFMSNTEVKVTSGNAHRSEAHVPLNVQTCRRVDKRPAPRSPPVSACLRPDAATLCALTLAGHPASGGGAAGPHHLRGQVRQAEGRPREVRQGQGGPGVDGHRAPQRQRGARPGAGRRGVGRDAAPRPDSSLDLGHLRVLAGL